MTFCRHDLIITVTEYWFHLSSTVNRFHLFSAINKSMDWKKNFEIISRSWYVYTWFWWRFKSNTSHIYIQSRDLCLLRNLGLSRTTDWVRFIRHVVNIFQPAKVLRGRNGNDCGRPSSLIMQTLKHRYLITNDNKKIVYSLWNIHVHCSI